MQAPTLRLIPLLLAGCIPTILACQPAAAQAGDGTARPQRAARVAEAFRVQHFTTADGLPSNKVLAIEQDTLGYLWIGTFNGLVRYDGYTFETFLPQPNDSTNFGGGRISDMHEDATGHLWFGGDIWDPGGLRRFDPRSEHFTRFRHDPDDPNSLIYDGVTAITSSRDEPEVLWIGAVDWFKGDEPADGGVSRLDGATGIFTNYTTENGLAGHLVTDVLMGRDGTPWVGTGEALNRFDPVTNTFTPLLLDPQLGPLSVIYEDRFGVLWFGTGGGEWIGEDGGLHRFDRETETFTSFLPQPTNPSDSRNQVNVLLEDRTGTLWVGTNGGLFTFNRESARFTLFPHQPSSSTIRSIYEDRFGVLWIGSVGGGLMKLERRLNPFTVYRHDPNDPNSLAEDRARAIYEDHEGILWIASTGRRGLLNRVNRKGGTVTRLPWPDPDAITSIYEDWAGTLWLGTCGPGPGLHRMNQGRNDSAGRLSFTHFGGQDTTDPLSSLCVNHMLEDRAGRFWIAAWGDGLILLDREAGMLTSYRNDPDDPFSDQLYHFFESQSEPGILWVSTEAGLSRFDTETKTFTNYHTETLSRTMMTHEDRVGRFWVVTALGGLHLFDRETGTIQETFTTEDGLSHNVVWSILEGDRGLLWLSTSNGLSRFDPETRSFRNFYARDGLPDNVFGEGSRFKSASGELFFGGANFAVSFFPDDITGNLLPPEVVLTGLEIAGEPAAIGPDAPLAASMMVTEAVTLSHTQNDLVFEYVGLHFINPVENRYRYVLEHYDDVAWVEAGTQRTARYPRLPPGAYVFRVQAASSDGVWNEEGASVRITILPPWWRTTWAYVLYGLLLVAGVFAVDRIQRRRLLRKERERAMARELERAREIEAMNRQLRVHEQQLEAQNDLLEGQKQRLLELDAAKSRFFANISHEFRTPLTLITGPLQDTLDGDYGPLPEALQERDRLLLKSARRLLRLINQLLDLAKLESDTMALRLAPGDLSAFLRDLVRAFTPLAERRKIMLRYQPESEVLPVRFDADKLEKVFANLLSNALKFTPGGGKVWVTVNEGVDNEDCGSKNGVAEEATSTCCVEVVIKDTGPGIPKEALTRIFDRFQQVDGTAARAHEGTGIGLSLAKELVALHGGQLLVESEPGFGTAFIVRLPLEVSEADGAQSGDVSAVLPVGAASVMLEEAVLETTTAAPASPAMAAAVGENTPTILIVEDNAEVRAFLRRHLETDYHIIEAADGADGLKAAREAHPALILSDVMMPGMDGYALCRALKADDTLCSIPVVLLTARASEEDTVEGLETGADDYIAKPFSMGELRVRIANLIASRRQLRRQFSREIVVQPAGIAVPSDEEAFLTRVLEVVEARLGDSTFGVNQLADEVGLSRRQLTRRVRALTNEAPGTLIHRMRLERAAQLLEAHAGTVSEIAYAVGFRSSSHFSVAFRKTFGTSPSDYIENGT